MYAHLLSNEGINNKASGHPSAGTHQPCTSLLKSSSSSSSSSSRLLCTGMVLVRCIYMVYGSSRSEVSEHAVLSVHLPCSALQTCAEDVIAILTKRTQTGAERLRLKKDFVANPVNITPSFQVSPPSVTPACQRDLKHPQRVSCKKCGDIWAS